MEWCESTSCFISAARGLSIQIITKDDVVKKLGIMGVVLSIIKPPVLNLN